MTDRSRCALQNGAALRLEFLRETGAPMQVSPMQALYELRETDNGRTGVPHSVKRHSGCTDDDDDDADEDGVRVYFCLAAREPRSVFRAKRESRRERGHEYVRECRDRICDTFVCPVQRLRFYAIERTMDAPNPAFTRESRSIQLIRNGVL